jgi:hypothetical protein
LVEASHCHELTTVDAIEVGATPNPVLPLFGAHEGEEVLAQRQFLQAVVLEDLPGESWREVSLLREENKQSPEKNHLI